MKHAIYIASQFDENTYKTIFTNSQKPMQAASKYHRLLCQGLAANGIDVCAYSVLPINRFNCSKKLVRVKSVICKKVQLIYPLILNFPVLKHLLLFIQSFFKVLFAPSRTVLFYDCLVIAASYGACFAAKLRKIPCISIVTDLPEFMGIAESKIGKAVNEKLLDLASAFLFLTQQMNEKVNKKNKPFIVMEGHIDSAMCDIKHNSFHNQIKKIIYAGGLQLEYGVKNLCDAFLMMAKKDEELHIYGDGAFRIELEKLCQKNKNIIFHGNVLNSEVVAAELDATLLVNPRPAESEFTKYSFPSKTMEYMVSGTPVVMTRLPGMPDEYCDYVYLFKSGSPLDMAEKMREILDQSKTELRLFGENAKRFVSNKKNNITQANNVIQFAKKLGW